MEKDSEFLFKEEGPAADISYRSTAESGRAHRSSSERTVTAVKAIGLVILVTMVAVCFVKVVVFEERLDFLQKSAQHDNENIRRYIDEQITIILEQVGPWT